MALVTQSVPGVVDVSTSKPDPQLQEIWEQVLRHFHATTERRLDDQSMPKPDTILSLQKEIDKQQQEFSKYREKKKRLFELMSMALKPVELLGNLAAGATSLVSILVSLPKLNRDSEQRHVE
jgi:fungal STAND N-terminal Goodbye domain